MDGFKMKTGIRCVLLLMSLMLSSSWAEEFELQPATLEHLHAMREGGYVLFIRHGPTDSALPDHVPIDLNDCSTQRPLTDDGRALMARVGLALQQADILLGPIHSSPLCRAVETAEILFGAGRITVDQNLMYVAALTTEEKQPIIQRTQALLSAPVPSGENRILVAHGPNMVEVMDYFPVEGTLVMIRPLPDIQGFEYLASIEPDHWPQLLSLME